MSEKRSRGLRFAVAERAAVRQNVGRSIHPRDRAETAIASAAAARSVGVNAPYLAGRIAIRAYAPSASATSERTYSNRQALSADSDRSSL